MTTAISEPLTEISVDQQGRGQASFQLDQPFADYDGVYIKAKPVDPTAEATGLDTLVRDNAGGLPVYGFEPGRRTVSFR